MLSNYLNIAFRNIRRTPGFSAINIIGLAAGLVCFILIGNYILFERSFDRFHEKADRIFRLTTAGQDGGNEFGVATTPTAAYPTFKRDFPEVLSGVRILSTADFSPTVVTNGDAVLEEKGFLWADSTFFDIFTFKILLGDPHTVLDGLYTVVLTESTARRYFGAANPIGKTLLVGKYNLVVTGVAADAPLNSQIKFDFVASFHSLDRWRALIWDSANFYTYLKLNDAASAPALAAKIKSAMPSLTGSPMTDGSYMTYALQPICDVHLHSTVAGGLEPGSDIQYLYIFSAIALLVLLIACINYINLATARAVKRAKEAGVRKVVGAQQSQLFAQFFAESALVTGIAMLLGLLGVYLTLPYFNKLTDRPLTISLLGSPAVLCGLLGLGLLVSLFAGAYPSLVMSKFRPIQVLKGNFQTSGSGGKLRKGLVVFQFGVSFFLMIGALVISRQVAFIQHRKLGFDKEKVLELPIDQAIRKNIAAIKQEIMADPAVQQVTLASENPVAIQGGYSMWAEDHPTDYSLGIGAVGGDPDYIKTLGMTLIAGTDFTDLDMALVAVDSEALRQYHFILNETAVRQLGWTPESAIGKRASLNGREGKVKGVVQDFHFASMREAIQPFALFITIDEVNKMILKLNTDHVEDVLSSLKIKWKARAPQRPFEYQFLDEQFDKLYRTEQRSGRIATIFAILAIMIACLGLFGLATFTAIQRTKEIGIRKVLGASVAGIISLLAKDFLKLVIIAIVIASPVAYYFMQKWLADFAYRIDIQWWMFATAGAAAVVIAFLTVGFQAVRAALANPVKSLRSE